MSKKYRSITLFVFCIFSSVLYSQIEKEKKPLTEILILLQEKYNHQFTYADDTIKDIYIKSPSENLTFKEILNYLKRETKLIFQILENNFVAISTQNTSFSICGYIIDYETRQPLETVTIIGKDNYTISDSFGYFKLKVSHGDENIIIRHLGHYPKFKPTYSFDQNNCINIFLLPQIETLSEIILTNFITKGIDKVADGTYTINFSNFGILPGLIETDVLQTVQALPGIQSVNETVSDINIRGGTNDQNLLLWDGIKMYQSGHFFGLISIFNPLITTDVSVIKNGTNVDFTDGVSGTIAMKTDTKINNEFIGSIGANFINVDGFVDVPLGENSSIQLSARKAISDIIETPTYDEYFDRIVQDTDVKNIFNSDIKFDFHDTSLRWLYNITDKDQIRLNFLSVNNELIFNETATIDQNEESKESRLIQNSIVGGLFYKRNWTDKFATIVQASETRYELEATNADILQQQRLFQENKVSETSIKLNTWYKQNDQLSFLNGYQFTETGITNLTDVDNPIFREFVREVIREHAVYSQINYISTSKRATIKAGIRYNYIEKFKKHIVEPRFNLNYKLLDHFSVEVLGELKHQNTSQIINFQNDFLGIEKRRWLLSNNEDIPIIRSKQASVGFNYSNKGWLISAEGYFKEIDGITSQSQGFLNQYTFEKANGSYIVKGMDFLINKRFNRLSTWLSYSYADNEYTFNDFQEINFPNNLDITHTITFGSSFSIRNFKVSAGFNWHSGKPTTNLVIGNEIVDNTVNYDVANSSRLREYLRVDASATYKFNITAKVRAQAGISIWNGLNQENIINNYYTIDANNTTKENSNKALDFTPNMSFRVVF
ncbi:MAG: TonB-dependent receptor [Flavobacteriaceae bacterium]|nr:TonB-dependent receptor [Flavobacteriaceae bacterium]